MSKNIYKTALDNVRFSENFETKTLKYLKQHASKSAQKTAERRLKIKKLYVPLAVACAMLLIITIPRLNNGVEPQKPNTGDSKVVESQQPKPDVSNEDKFRLSNAVGKVSVKYIKNKPSISISADMDFQNEEEIFHNYNTDIFRGEIEEIKNLEIDLNGHTEYRALARIKVDKNFRGNIQTGDRVSVLLPCPIGEDVWIEDTDVAASMREGMTGIFMPVKYDKTNYYETNGARIY